MQFQISLNKVFPRKFLFWLGYYFLFFVVTLIIVCMGHSVLAQGTTPTATVVQTMGFKNAALRNIWVLIAAALVFFMNAGFAYIETGFCRRSNFINVLAKNLIVFCVSAVAFWICGFGFMFGDTTEAKSWIGNSGFFFVSNFANDNDPWGFPAGFSQLKQTYGNLAFMTIFVFQLAFAGVPATIVSGAIAERVKFWAFILFVFVMVGFIYPVIGHWIWSSNGWLLQSYKFRDFAGSTVIHTVGGVGALVGAMVLGPRNGMWGYNRSRNEFDDRWQKFVPFSLGYATLGCFILWFGWLGFNGGSSASLEYVPHAIATTIMAGSMAGITPMLLSNLILAQKANFGSIINGILGGLVGITASAGYVSIWSSIIIGFVGAIVVMVTEQLLILLKIDDPVGAVPVHLGGGLWGTLAVGFFADIQSLEYRSGLHHVEVISAIYYQFWGWLIVFTVTFILSILSWLVIGLFLYVVDVIFDLNPNHANTRKSENFISWLWIISMNGLRVSDEEEKSGSDGVFYNPTD